MRSLSHACLALIGVGFFLSCLASASAQPAKHSFAIGEKDFLLDGKPLQIRCGEIHFARVPREYWQHRLKAIKAMGLNTVCAYLFWNYHEWREGRYDWGGQRDAAEFCRLAQQEGLRREASAAADLESPGVGSRFSFMGSGSGGVAHSNGTPPSPATSE